MEREGEVGWSGRWRVGREVRWEGEKCGGAGVGWGGEGG